MRRRLFVFGKCAERVDVEARGAEFGGATELGQIDDAGDTHDDAAKPAE